MLSLLCYPKVNLKQNMKTTLDKTRSYYVFLKTMVQLQPPLFRLQQVRKQMIKNKTKQFSIKG